MNKLTTLLTLVLGCTSAYAVNEPANAPVRPALTVSTAHAQTVRLPIRLSANGNIAAWQEAIVSSQVNGLKLISLKVDVGDSVKAGQELALFDAESVQQDVNQAQASLLEAEATLAEATRYADRVRPLQGTGAMSEQEISQLLSNQQTAQARVEMAKASLAGQKLRLKHTRVPAPDAGVITSRQATLGSVAAAGTELFRLIRQNKLEWRAEVTASELSKLQVGGHVKLSTVNGRSINGKIRKIAPTVDPQTRLALVYVDLAESKDVKAGMFAKGEFELGSSSALTLPQQAVVIRDGFSYVFRLNQDNRVSQIRVNTGRRSADRVEVLDGIKTDQLLVVQGAGFLNDGDLVKVVMR